MSDKVVPFRKPGESQEDAQYIWACGCGCRDFLLVHGGIVVCKDCNEYKPELIWGFTKQDQT